MGWAMLVFVGLLLSAVPTSSNSIGGQCNPSKGPRQCPRRSHCKPSKNSLYEDAGKCVHRKLKRFDGIDFATVLVVFSATALAAGGGIGGGGLLVPIYLLLEDFSTSQATALSLATITGGAISNLFIYARRYHPNPTRRRPLIDYDSALLLAPALLAGTSIGVMCSISFPQWLVVSLLIAVLAFTAYRTIKKGIASWARKHEPDTFAAVTSEPAQSVRNQNSVDDENEVPSLGSPPGSPDMQRRLITPLVLRSESFELGFPETSEESFNKDLLAGIYADEARLFPKEKIGTTFAIWAVVFTLTLLRGGSSGSQFVKSNCGDSVFWTLVVANMTFLTAATLLIRNSLLKRFELKQSHGHRAMAGDLQWTKETTLKYPLVSFFAGFGAGLLGIGGGMVLGPLMIALGCLPQVTVATNAWFVLITATAGLAQVLIYGLLPTGYAAVFALVGVAATLFGQNVAEYAVRRYQQEAIIVVLIGVVLLVAMVLMGAVGILDLVDGAPAGFGPICGR